MIVPALLILTLLLSVLFVWRLGRSYPSLAVFAAGVAAVIAVLLLRRPVFAAIGLALLLAMIYFPTRPGGNRE